MTTPYLSVVATARNDNHGGNMLRRMQIFINGLLEQCRRYQLEAELIIVEWNPPAENPSLADVLSWQVEDSPCIVRIIQVPPELHQQLNHAAALPLFQMLAKNVGIRRARGQFILATNIDLLFSDDLFHFIASRQLEEKTSYRLDRYDVQSDVPLEAPLSDQLDYCAQNILRICRRDGFEEGTIEEPIDEPEIPVVPPATWYKPVLESAAPLLPPIRNAYRRLLPRPIRDAFLRTVPSDVQHWLINEGMLTVQPLPPPPPPPEPDPAQELAALWQYPRLHTNACGDFTLMSRSDWFAIRGYPEWEIFSFHLDSVLLYIAHYAGIKEVMLDDSMRLYHIEHTSGWTPETEQTLNKRLARLRLPQLSNEQVDALARLMQQLNKPLVFNDETWGMAAHSLPETTISDESDRKFAIAALAGLDTASESA